MVKKDATKRMREAYEFFVTLPEIKNALAGRKMGHIAFRCGGHNICMAWLAGKGLAWNDNGWDFDPDLLAEIKSSKHRIKVIRDESAINRAEAIRSIVGKLAIRGHRLASSVLNKKENKIRRKADEMGFKRKMLYHGIDFGWTIYHHLSSSRVLVFTTLSGYTYIGVPPNSVFCAGYNRVRPLMLLDIYNALITAFKRNDAFEILAETPEAKAMLLMQMLAKGRSVM